MEEQDEFTYDIEVSFIQIYLELIQDLIDPENEDVRIWEDPS